MAIYEYYCPTCRSRFEQRRPMSDAALAVRCARGHEAERAISAFAVARPGAGPGAGEEVSMASGGCCGGGACACAN